MKRILLIILIGLLTNINAQTPTQKSYSGSTSDVAKSFFKMYDNGFLLGGQTGNWASVVKDIFLLKTNENGDTLWSKTYGGVNDDEFKDLKETTDSGAIFIGTTNSFGLNNKDIYVTKVDSSGNVEWSKTYGGGNNDICSSIIETISNDYVLVGNTFNTTTSTSDLLVIKLDINGDTLWSKQYGGATVNGNSIGRKIIETSDSNYAILSFFANGGDPSTMITKIDTNGNELWSQIYYTLGALPPPLFNTFKETSTGGYVLGGYDYIFNMTMMKVDISGNVEWSKNMGVEIAPGLDSNYVDIFVKDTSFLLESGTINNSILLIKSDTLGNVEWGNEYALSNITSPKIEQRKNNNYAILAGGIVDFSLLFVDSVGNAGCNQIAYTVNSSPLTILNGAISFLSVTNFSPVVNNAPTVVGNMQFQVTAPCFVAQEICLVTTDSTLNKNKIVWEKQLPSTIVKEYNIYKESATFNVYDLIGTVSSDSLSEFIDTTSNPLQNADRYKISQTNINNFVSDYSLPHKTIHLAVNLGINNSINLIWNAYEGVNYSTFNIWRGNDNQLVLLTSVNSSVTSYTDLNPTATDSIYIIEVVLPSTCVSTAKQTAFSSIISNKSSSSDLLIGIDEEKVRNGIKIHPNPTINILTIEFPFELFNKEKSIDVFNLLGKKVYSEVISSTNEEHILNMNLSSLDEGMYLITITSESKKYTYKLLKAK